MPETGVGIIGMRYIYVEACLANTRHFDFIVTKVTVVGEETAPVYLLYYKCTQILIFSNARFTDFIYWAQWMLACYKHAYLHLCMHKPPSLPLCVSMRACVSIRWSNNIQYSYITAPSQEDTDQCTMPGLLYRKSRYLSLPKE
jgi:hypothetical protein